MEERSSTGPGSASGDGPSRTGGGTIGGGVGTITLGPFLDGESQVPMSMLCLPGIIGGGGMPGPFFFTVVLVVFTCGLAGCEAIEAQVIFLGASFCCCCC